MGTGVRDEEVRAIHEAGHAVAAFRLSVGVIEIHIALSAERQGKVQYAPFDEAQLPSQKLCDEAFHRLIVWLAGLEAQRALTEERPRRTEDVPDSYWDYTKANFEEARGHGAGDDFHNGWHEWVRFIDEHCGTIRLIRRRTARQLGRAQLFREARKQAFTLFTTDANRAAVRALADELLREKILDGARARAVVEAAWQRGAQ